MPKRSIPAAEPGLTVDAESDAPSSSRRLRQAYMSHATVGYMTYGVGAATAFIAVGLGLSDAEAGLHSSAMATGLMAAGITGERLDRLFGERAVHIAAMAALTLGILGLAIAPALAITLAGAAAIGAGDGLLLMFISRTTTAGGGALGRARLARSTLIAMVTALSASLVISIGVWLGLGWQVHVVPAFVLIGIGVLIARTRGGRRAGGHPPAGRLPKAYWVAWLLLVNVVLIEFAIVFWAAAMVRERTAVPLEDAAFVLAAFVLGIVLGRGTLSFRAVAAREPIGLLRVGLFLVVSGVMVAWLSPSLALSGVALIVAGMGLGTLFPLSGATAIALAPGRAHVASARIVLAIGTGMFTGPLILGVAADATGLVAAWLIVPLACATALAMSVPVKRLLAAVQPA